MKNQARNILLLFICILFSSFSFHKFYVGVYQLKFVPEKKMLQITSRIFVDDLNDALEKKYKRKTFVGLSKESEADVKLFQSYLAENFKVKINGQSKEIQFLSKELEDENVLVLYSKIINVTKIQSIELQNKMLLDWNGEQQNITHFLINDSKKTFLYTHSAISETIKY